MQKLWRTCEAKYIFSNAARRRTADFFDVDAPSRRASLDRARVASTITAAVPFTSRITTLNIHRFEETIGGRAYHIEVVPVSNRWRAQLMRTPGVPTAMMPFYGQTPDEAAKQLTDWLCLAHRRTAPSV